ncbi:FmdB family zinc ribbon protein [Salinisphaera aquimarina]|uniref:FmdB family zinc ribbon protein n=1 Tax=Salinisphaera aquimarina TaxID=2094031 RepID=A0ABV7ESA1_9GAMM
MPIYEYVCRECGEELEQLQRMSDDALTDCPACGKSALKRKISAAGFRLSGGGWYETDFKSDGKRNLAGNNDSSSSSTSTASGSSSKNGERKSTSEASSKPAAKDSGPSSSTAKSKSKPTKDKSKPSTSSAG